MNKFSFFSLPTILFLILFLKYIPINILPDVTLYTGSSPKTILTDSTSNYILSVSLIESLNFLEHKILANSDDSKNILIATSYNNENIYVSKDLGLHFKRVYLGKEKFIRCFTTSAGNHLLWENSKRRIWLFNKNWNVLKAVKTGRHPWLGTWGISQNDKCIMYAEYAEEDDTLFVWRSKDGGFTWEKVFFQLSRLFNTPQIKHFHTIQYDPYYPDNWYLSSGDEPYESKVWLSKDNGSTWKEVTDPHPIGTNLQSVHRYTSPYFDSSYIYWGTDDIMNDHAKFVKVKRSEPLKVEVVANMDNLVRSLVSTPFGLVFISEQKNVTMGKLRNLTIYISPDKKCVQELVSIPSCDKIRTGFTFSLSSKVSTGDGIFFSYFGGHAIWGGRSIFAKKRGMLKWKISIKKPKL